jgi:hypothetical protein
MPHLTALDVFGCAMTDALFAHIAEHCRALTALKMRGVADPKSMTVAAIAHLSRLPRLRWSLVDLTRWVAEVEVWQRWDAHERYLLAEQTLSERMKAAAARATPRKPQRYVNANAHLSSIAPHGTAAAGTEHPR